MKSEQAVLPNTCLEEEEEEENRQYNITKAKAKRRLASSTSRKMFVNIDLFSKLPYPKGQKVSQKGLQFHTLHSEFKFFSCILK
jgi:hypothetical protein